MSLSCVHFNSQYLLELSAPAIREYLKHAVIDIDIIHSGGLINWLLSSSLFLLFSSFFFVDR